MVPGDFEGCTLQVTPCARRQPAVYCRQLTQDNHSAEWSLEPLQRHNTRNVAGKLLHVARGLLHGPTLPF